MSLTAHPTEKWKLQDQPSSEKGKTESSSGWKWWHACTGVGGAVAAICRQTTTGEKKGYLHFVPWLTKAPPHTCDTNTQGTVCLKGKCHCS